MSVVWGVQVLLLECAFMPIHISREARDRYIFNDALLARNGKADFINFAATREFAARVNTIRKNADEKQLLPAQLNALSLLDELAQATIHAYCETLAPSAFADALKRIQSDLGADALKQTQLGFCECFPTIEVYHNRMSAQADLASSANGALEEMLLLSLANQNPAAHEMRELFDDRPLREGTRYTDVIQALELHFDALPPTLEGQSLMTLLKLPLLLAHDSLLEQLQIAVRRWRPLLQRGSLTRRLGWLLNRVETALDFIRQEDAYIFNQRNAMFAPTAQPPQFFGGGGQDAEPEQFSPDCEWMPRVVMMAKSTYVWLDQLSKKYQRDIARLDQIPNEELDQLQRWGITGLWLIGLWERSIASQSIKRMMGQHEAVASAYSLHSYDIARDLGGWDALANLRERAWQRGIRLGSDMVPNHFGIDAAWVSEHPDWFLQLDAPPYPGYTFNGPDLSRDARISVHIEDHYWDRSDAAVVFKTRNRQDGRERYIYHGNDGTRTPWNDTAQINYLNPEAREAIIQTILHVARNFPIIRFDAAMTLAKRHIQRLWFPQPGQADSIPSRTAHGLTRAELDALMPREFWRDVVDRAAIEAPDTLLLAEAFWMMEGYFVRTLGMHRVYNSAFMIMLRNEDNEGYRKVMKDTLAFDPQILRRYVNFMNNPDEKTAAEQFGRGEKYFGVAAMMATLPGLPMIGHGQFEGFEDKYGMEFKRALRDEPVDWGLLQHHERVIAPLLQRRHLFADVDHFTLFDFVGEYGDLNENVFCYTNQAGDERALFIYNNHAHGTSGSIHISSEIKPQFEHDAEQQPRARSGVRRISLAHALGLSDSPSAYLVYRDQFTGQEYLRSGRELHERGLAFALKGYECHVLLDLRVEFDNADGHLAELHAQLDGRGTASVNEDLRKRREDGRREMEQSSSDSTPASQFDLIVHSTHEAGIKLGGIGAVLDGLLGAPEYLAGAKRTLLVGPMHVDDAVEMERLFSSRNRIVACAYFSQRGIASCAPELVARLGQIEQKYDVRICYARKQFGDHTHEILLIDPGGMSDTQMAEFKFGVWQKFGLDCARYEHVAEFNYYMKLALPAFEALKAVLGDLEPAKQSQNRAMVCHEFMGLPLWYAAQLMEPGQWRSAYVAHEVPTARSLIEKNEGHDTRFYNTMRIAMPHGLNIDAVFGNQSGYFKHAMLKTATHCDRVLAVSDIIAEELHFVDRAFRRKRARVACNGVPANKISLTDKCASAEKLREIAQKLGGFAPTFVFTHVARLVRSKAFWRDVMVMRELDAHLARRGESAVYFAVANSHTTGRSPHDAQHMAREYGWPAQHREGWPDLVEGELGLWQELARFNESARASRIVLVNQFGFDSVALGGSIPDGVSFNDLRIGTDLEFGQSIYEPFGIAQLEPLTYGALCVLSDACGCKAIVEVGHLGRGAGTHLQSPVPKLQNLIIGQYTHLPHMVDLRGALEVGGQRREEVEQRVAREVADEIVQRLPRSDAERAALMESGYALARSLSWDVVARDMFFPALG